MKTTQQAKIISSLKKNNLWDMVAYWGIYSIHIWKFHKYTAELRDVMKNVNVFMLILQITWTLLWKHHTVW